MEIKKKKQEDKSNGQCGFFKAEKNEEKKFSFSQAFSNDLDNGNSKNIGDCLSDNLGFIENNIRNSQ